MLIRTWSLDAITIIDVHGHLDVESGAALHDALGELFAAGRCSVVLNLVGITGIDAAGLGMLVDAFATAQTARGDLKIVVRSASTRELLARTHLLGLLPTVTTEAEAITAFERVHSR
ncbi:MAG TPA: STAS domain-containing protein [Vicinamibacterales bacterium]|jgi:anti-anti-sigma factor|nr:STAS domain-containing protein [Vicinamibacterales bacterium]